MAAELNDQLFEEFNKLTVVYNIPSDHLKVNVDIKASVQEPQIDTLDAEEEPADIDPGFTLTSTPSLQSKQYEALWKKLPLV